MGHASLASSITEMSPNKRALLAEGDILPPSNLYFCASGKGVREPIVSFFLGLWSLWAQGDSWDPGSWSARIPSVSKVTECEKIDGSKVMECEKIVGSRVKECEKNVGPWVMECEKIVCSRVMECEKIVCLRVKKHANSL